MIHDVVIIGSGPSAQTAAIYAARAGLKTVVYGGFMAGDMAAGGQLMITTDVENFPGFPDGIMGPDLMDRMIQQSKNCGALYVEETIEKVDFKSKPFKLYTQNQEIQSRSVIVATGATARRLESLKGHKTFWNKGVSACAVCDGPAPIFKNKPLCVLGGGDSACEEAIFLTKYASKVNMIVRKDHLRASKVMADRAINHEKINILFEHEPVELKGQNTLSHVVLKTKQSEKTIEASGFFYAIGHDPNVSWFKDSGLEFDSDGYILAHDTKTNVEGVFACGDVTDKKYRQAITAAGMGCQAALECVHFLSK